MNKTMNSLSRIFIFLSISCFLSISAESQDITVFEKVYLHLDRHYYLSGDDIWFKAYLFDAQTNKSSPNNSRILYAELILPESKRLDRLTLFVDSVGCAVGDFRLKKCCFGKISHQGIYQMDAEFR